MSLHGCTPSRSTQGRATRGERGGGGGREGGGEGGGGRRKGGEGGEEGGRGGREERREGGERGRGGERKERQGGERKERQGGMERQGGEERKGSFHSRARMGRESSCRSLCFANMRTWVGMCLSVCVFLGDVAKDIILDQRCSKNVQLCLASYQQDTCRSSI